MGSFVVRFGEAEPYHKAISALYVRQAPRAHKAPTAP